MNHRISKDAFEKWYNEPSVVAAILPLYLSGLYLSRYGGHKDAPSLHDYFDSKEEAIRHYDYLKNVYQSISAKEIYSPYVFLWESTELTPFGNRSQDGVYHLDDQRFCIKRRSLHLSAFFGYLYAGSYIGGRIKSPDQPFTGRICAAITGRPFAGRRDEAYKVLSEMALSPEQNQKVEELLRFKYSEMRINAINLLMKQPKEQLSGSYPPLTNRQGGRNAA